MNLIWKYHNFYLGEMHFILQVHKGFLRNELCVGIPSLLIRGNALYFYKQKEGNVCPISLSPYRKGEDVEE